MVKKKKWLVALVTTAAAVGVAGTVISCGTGSRELTEDELVQRQTLNRYSNGPLQVRGYDYDPSYSYGTTNTLTASMLNPYLFRTKAEGKGSYDAEGKLVSATYNYNAFVWADQVKITKNDGTVVEYDSDEAEITPELNPKALSIFLVKTSANAKSINNPKFMEDLKTATRVDIRIKEGKKWVDRKGVATAYDVKARDFFYGWMRTKLVDTKYRRENGGSKELDEKIVAERNISPAYFGENTSYGNEYLYQLFGIDTTKMSNEADAVTGDKKQYFSFYGMDGEAAQFHEFFNKQLFSASNELVAAPSDYIKSLVSTPEAGYQSATGKSLEFGVYNYGGDNNKLLFAGAYYLETVDIINNYELFKQNTQYPEQDWLDNKFTFKAVRNDYRNISADNFNQFIFNQFKRDETPLIPFSLLNDSQKKDSYILKNLFTIKNSEKDSVFAYTQPVTNPWAGAKVTDYYYNDVYAKLIWGGTRQELSNGSVSTSETFFKGTGLRFRSLLQSAVNHLVAVNEGYPGTNLIPWLPSLAPGNSIGGSDQSSSKYKNFVDGIEELTNLGFVKKDLTLGATTNYLKDGKLDNTKELEENYKSKIYDQVKAEMKVLLDEFYASNTSFAGQKVEFKIWRPTIAVMTTAQESMYKNILKVLNGLDERLKIEQEIFTDRDVAIKATSRNKAISSDAFTGWGYDWNGIGSGLDGWLDLKGAHVWGAFSLYSQLTSEEKSKSTGFAQFIKSSEWIRQYAESGKFLATHNKDASKNLVEKTITVKNFTALKDLNNKEFYDMAELLSGYTADGKAVDGFAELAKMWLQFQNAHTNEELINFSQQSMIIRGTTIGFALTTRYVIPNPDLTSPRVFNLQYTLASIDSQIENYVNWTFTNKKNA